MGTTVISPATLDRAAALEAAIVFVTRSHRTPSWASGLSPARATRIRVLVLAAQLSRDRWPRRLSRLYLGYVERGLLALPPAL